MLEIKSLAFPKILSRFVYLRSRKCQFLPLSVVVTFQLVLVVEFRSSLILGVGCSTPQHKELHSCYSSMLYANKHTSKHTHITHRHFTDTIEQECFRFVRDRWKTDGERPLHTWCIQPTDKKSSFSEGSQSSNYAISNCHFPFPALFRCALNITNKNKATRP